jgi:hypothetical protein
MQTNGGHVLSALREETLGVKSLFQRPVCLLGMGGLLIIAANFRWGVGAAAWIAPIPLIRCLRITHGWRSRLGFGAVLAVVWTAATFKIVTPPLSPIAAVPLGVLASAFSSAAFLAWDALRSRAPPAVALWIYPASVVICEWVAQFTAHLRRGALWPTRRSRIYPCCSWLRWAAGPP